MKTSSSTFSTINFDYRLIPMTKTDRVYQTDTTNVFSITLAHWREQLGFQLSLIASIIDVIYTLDSSLPFEPGKNNPVTPNFLDIDELIASVR